MALEPPGAAWYWAAVTYKAIPVGHPRKRHLWERTVFLVRAVEETDARLEAERIALAKEYGYEVAAGERIRWVLQEIEEVQPLFDAVLKNGTEVFWQFFERVDKSPE